MSGAEDRATIATLTADNASLRAANAHLQQVGFAVGQEAQRMSIMLSAVLKEHGPQTVKTDTILGLGDSGTINHDAKDGLVTMSYTEGPVEPVAAASPNGEKILRLAGGKVIHLA